MTTKVRLSPPVITPEDRKCVCAALECTKIVDGPAVGEFERAVAARLGGEGVALISGTAALHLALVAVGVGPSDLVAMPSLTFVAPAHVARYVGADPLLFDSEPNYRQLDADGLIAWLQEECESDGKIAIHTATRRRIGAIVSVDLLGHPCDIGLLADVARGMGIPVVEDAAQGFGATLRGRPVGAHADVTCLSFNANKIVTSGGGGMLLSKKAAVVERVRHLANQAKQDGPNYIHDEVGFNYRLPSAQAALGLAQFGRFDQILEEKARMAAFYEDALADIPGLTMPRRSPEATVSNWLFTVDVDPELFGHTAHGLMSLLAERHEVETRPIFTPLHMCGAYRGLQAGECPVAESLAATGLSLPSSVDISDEDLECVCEGIRSEAAGA